MAYQRNDLDSALRQVTEGIALCLQFLYPAPLGIGLVTLAWIRQALGDPGGALEAMGEAGLAALGLAVTGLLNPVPAQRARLLLAQGDVVAAARWTQERGLGPSDEPGYPRPFSRSPPAPPCPAPDRRHCRASGRRPEDSTRMRTFG